MPIHQRPIGSVTRHCVLLWGRSDERTLMLLFAKARFWPRPADSSHRQDVDLCFALADACASNKEVSVSAAFVSGVGRAGTRWETRLRFMRLTCDACFLMPPPTNERHRCHPLGSFHVLAIMLGWHLGNGRRACNMGLLDAAMAVC